MPAHMRSPRDCSRGRATVRLLVEIDGAPALERSFPAAGLWSDGQSFAIAPLDVAAGAHRVSVSVATGSTSADGTSWDFGDSRELEFSAGHRHVISIDNARLDWN